MVSRYREHELVLRGRAQATSPEAWRDYRRRRHLMEGSFAQSANCHGCKRSRWRRLWRQQIQDWLIAACQNVKTLVSAIRSGPGTMEGRGRNRAALALDSILERLRHFAARFRQTITLGPHHSFYRC
jgi:hypothetical protein